MKRSQDYKNFKIKVNCDTLNNFIFWKKINCIYSKNNFTLPYLLSKISKNIFFSLVEFLRQKSLDLTIYKVFSLLSKLWRLKEIHQIGFCWRGKDVNILLILFTAHELQVCSVRPASRVRNFHQIFVRGILLNSSLQNVLFNFWQYINKYKHMSLEE